MSSLSFTHQLKVNFTWHRSDGGEILKEHKCALIEAAKAQISEDRGSGQSFGDLHFEFYMDRRDEDDGYESIEYHGKWAEEKDTVEEGSDVFVL